MTEWWQKGYPGGPMVAVRGFPRELYSPSEKEQHSVDGPDVEAYKRTVSRAGRWVWTKFDQDYSDPFAHGKAGGQVKDSGIEGIQRQQKMVDDGIVGKETFNALRSIRIPDGLPHAGEPAMDARSVELINAAYDKFKGQEPAPPSSTSSAKARMDNAGTQIGIKENPANSNQVKYCDWYGMVGPWCAMFVTWCDQTSSNPSNSLKKGSKYAYVPYVVSDARLGYNGLSITSSPKYGDMVCFDWDRDGEFDHIGFFDKWTNQSQGVFATIEGNTSSGNWSNGGEVMRCSRDTGGYTCVFVRIAE